VELYAIIFLAKSFIYFSAIPLYLVNLQYAFIAYPMATSRGSGALTVAPVCGVPLPNAGQ